MKAYYLSLILLFSCGNYRAQDLFDWVTAAQSMNMTYYSMAPHPDGGIVLLAERTQVSYGHKDPKFIQGNGTEYGSRNLKWNSSVYVLMRFDRNGIVKWDLTFDDDYVTMHQLTVDETGGIHVFAFVDYYDEDDEGNEIGYIPEFSEEPRKPGYYIINLTDAGKLNALTHIANIEEEAEPEVASIRIYEDDYLISGFTEGGPIASNLDVKALKGGGEFVMRVNKKGIPVWADIVSYRKNSCCTQTSEGSQMDVGPDGTIYLGGTYFIGGVFSNGLQTMAPEKYTGKKPGGTEAYVVAYSPDGKIKWVSTDKVHSRFHAMKASKDGILVGHRIQYGDKAFGEKVDTLSTYNMVLTFIDKKGKTKWNIVTQAERFDNMILNNKGQFVVAGTFKRTYGDPPPKRHFGKMELPDNHEAIVATIDTKGEVTHLWTAKILHSSERFLLDINKFGELFLAAEVWCGLSLDLDMIDKDFPNVKCYGGVPIFGKITYP